MMETLILTITLIVGSFILLLIDPVGWLLFDDLMKLLRRLGITKNYVGAGDPPVYSVEGQLAEVRVKFSPSGGAQQFTGKVFVDGALWDARCDILNGCPPAVGDKVRVLSRDGLILEVAISSQNR